MKPRLALCNIFSDTKKLKAFAMENGFSGIDWSFEADGLPKTPAEESSWVKQVSVLKPMEVRYHCPFYRIDLGHDNPDEARKAETLFKRIIRLVSKAGGEYLTIHIGLGHDSTEPLSWDTTIEALRRLVQYGAEHRLTVCLENLAWGWTSRPHLFEKLIRKSGAAVTFDIGHAYVSESVLSQHYAMEDFVTPHANRVLNAHIYHEEVSGLGHMPPQEIREIEERLSLLRDLGCEWWVIEIHEPEGLLLTKEIVDEYLFQMNARNSVNDGRTANILPLK